MRTLKILSFALMSVLLGCNESDNESYSALEGEWNLVKISGGFNPENLDIPEGLITYDFNTQLQKVTIHNNTELLSPESGIYSYTIDEDPESNMCLKTIAINNGGDWCFLLDGSNMSFDLTPVDGLRYDLQR